jgi:hypothetical protein
MLSIGGLVKAEEFVFTLGMCYVRKCVKPLKQKPENSSHPKSKRKQVGSEERTAGSTKMAVFWAVAPSGLVEIC